VAVAVRRESDPFGWREEGKCLMRAVAGGAIVGMPLLYTMEMWWHGSTLSPWHLLAVLLGSVAVCFLFSLLSGFRPEYSPAEAAGQAVTAVGVAIVLSAAILLLIGEIGRETSLATAVGKIVLEAAPVSIGVSFANSQLLHRSRTGEDEEDGEKPKPPEDPEREQLKADLRDASATLAGSLVFALNIAPTEEVIKIAAGLSPWQLLLLLLGTSALCYVILFASGFEQHVVHVESVFQHPVAETVLATGISLAVAFVLLLVVGQRETMSHWYTAVAATVTLGLPAVVGGAAGRVII
jgi:putative integral membrane protein (TIGR02587 family)